MTISLYLGQEYLFSFFVAFLFFFFIFFLNHLLLLAEDILSKNVPFFKVVLIIIYSLPAIIAFSFPFASLVGGLMAIGRFSSDNEILSMQASGISHSKLFVPFVILGILFSMVSFVMNDYFLPLGTINFSRLFREILYSNPELELESNTIKRYQDSIIIPGRVEGKVIEDLVIIDKTPEKDRRIITAREAFLTRSESQEGVISLKLSDIFSHTSDSRKGHDFTYFTADAMDYNILLKDITFSITSLSPKEMSSVDVWREIVEKKQRLTEKEKAHEKQVLWERAKLKQIYWGALGLPSQETSLKTILNKLDDLQRMPIQDRSLQNHLLEFHTKFSVPFACLAFVFLAYPAGLFTKRGGRSVGFGIGLLISVFYWAMLIGGKTLGIRMNYSPLLSMWFPNMFIFLIGSIVFFLRFRR